MSLRTRLAPVALLALLGSACNGGTPATSPTTAPATATDGAATATSASPAATGSTATASAAPAGGPATVTDPPSAIVSLSATATEMLFAIGAGDAVVAVDDQSDFPPEAPMTELSGLQPNTEAIAELAPDLVVYAFDPDQFGAELDALGIAGLQLPAAEDLDDTYAQITQLGELTGQEEEAGQLVARMRADIAEIVGSAPSFPDPPTYYHELDDTLFTATSDTFIGQIYGLLGMDNIADEAPDAAGGFPQLSAEFIIDADPEYIFLADTLCCGQNAETVAARPGWSEIQAVRDGNVVPLDDDVASRWGPRIVDFLAAVAAGLS